jgi:hypothetical protein
MKSDILVFFQKKKICRENSSSIQILHEQRILYMKTYVHLWQCLAEFFLEWEMFQIQIAEKVKKHVSRSTTFPVNRAVYEIKWKKLVEPDRPQIIIWRMRIVYTV